MRVNISFSPPPRQNPGCTVLFITIDIWYYCHRKMDGLCELLAECDYICNVLPQTPETDDILSHDVLSNCTKKPVFMNIGRGNAISEEAILKALDRGWISHAILDVFREEPLPKESPLWSSPKVIYSGFIPSQDSFVQCSLNSLGA